MLNAFELKLDKSQDPVVRHSKIVLSLTGFLMAICSDQSCHNSPSSGSYTTPSTI